MKAAVSDAIRVLALSAAMAGPAMAADVQGSFVLDGKALQPSEAAAFRIRDQADPRQYETYVMLTTTPVDRAHIAAAIDPYSAAINDKAVRGVDYLAFSIDADGRTGMNAHVGGVQYLDTSGNMMGMQGALISKCTENGTRIECTVKTDKPVTTPSGPSWTLNVRFATEVSVRKPGTALAKDGAAPGKAFLQLVAAVGASDLARILALLPPDEAENYRVDWQTPEENLESAKESLGFHLPKNPRITGGELVSNDEAVLEVEGVPFEDAKMLYLVRMRQIDGRWLYDRTTVAGILD